MPSDAILMPSDARPTRSNHSIRIAVNFQTSVPQSFSSQEREFYATKLPIIDPFFICVVIERLEKIRRVKLCEDVRASRSK